MSERNIVPVWEKYALTVQEAAAYFRIGENKLRRIISEDKEADFILWNGNRPQIKRTLLKCAEWLLLERSRYVRTKTRQ